MAVLKYKDPTTGDWIELSNAVGDTLPIGTIVEYDGTIVPTNWEKVNDYSTEEVKTGETWIDGKPIYRKIFVGNWISNTLAWTNLVKGNISNCDTVISIKGLIKNPRSGDNIPIPSYENTNYFANIMYNQSDDYIKCFLNGWTYNAFKMTYIIVLEYTKTTD